MDKAFLIEKLREDLAREMTHMTFYLKNSATLKGLHRQEIRELFLEEAASEMKHVQEFQDLIIGLGGKIDDVKVRDQDIFLYDDPQAAVKYAWMMENEVVTKYTERIKQAEELGGPDGQYVEIFLEDQLAHSRADADNLKLLGA